MLCVCIGCAEYIISPPHQRVIGNQKIYNIWSEAVNGPKCIKQMCLSSLAGAFEVGLFLWKTIHFKRTYTVGLWSAQWDDKSQLLTGDGRTIVLLMAFCSPCQQLLFLCLLQRQTHRNNNNKKRTTTLPVHHFSFDGIVAAAGTHISDAEKLSTFNRAKKNK